MLNRLFIKWLVWRGKAIDIWSKSEYPAGVLSNLCSNGFRFDGMICGSMEGFLQSPDFGGFNISEAATRLNPR